MTEGKKKKSKSGKYPAKVSKECFFDITGVEHTMQINENGIAMIKNLASIGTPYNDIAILLGCAPNTLRSELNKAKVDEAYELGKAAGRAEIRQALRSRIKQGSDKCIIFASKAELGMSDTVLPSTEASALDGFIRAIDKARDEDRDEDGDETCETPKGE